MNSQPIRERFVDTLVKCANVQNETSLAKYLGIDKRKVSYWKSENGNVDTDLTIQFFRTETINFLQELVDDLRGERDRSREIYEEIGRKCNQSRLVCKAHSRPEVSKISMGRTRFKLFLVDLINKK